jgi:hypothetical protein
VSRPAWSWSDAPHDAWRSPRSRKHKRMDERSPIIRELVDRLSKEQLDEVADATGLARWTLQLWANGRTRGAYITNVESVAAALGKRLVLVDEPELRVIQGGKR